VVAGFPAKVRCGLRELLQVAEENAALIEPKKRS